MKSIIRFNILIACLFFVDATLAQVPKWDWVKVFSGGVDSDASARASVTDKKGNTFIGGLFRGTLTLDTFNLKARTAGGDMFLAKIDRCGKVLWAKSPGGNPPGGGGGGVYGLCIDKFGNSYYTGSAGDSSVFDKDTIFTKSSGYNFFIAKYDSSGKTKWVKNVGKVGKAFTSTMGNALSADTMGNVFFAANIFLGDSLVFDSIIVRSSSGYNSGSVIGKYDSKGKIVWAKFIGITSVGGAVSNGVRSIAVDKLGHVLITGDFESYAKFDDTTLVCQPSIGGWVSKDIFIAKYTSEGKVSWAKSYGGNGSDGGYNIILDELDNIYIHGAFSNEIRFDNVSFSAPSNKSGAYLAKMDSLGNCKWAKYVKYLPDLSGIAVNKQHQVFTPVTLLDSNGTQLWDKPLLTPVTKYAYSYLFGAGVDGNSNFYISGFLQGDAYFDNMYAASSAKNKGAVLVGKLLIDSSYSCNSISRYRPIVVPGTAKTKWYFSQGTITSKFIDTLFCDKNRIEGYYPVNYQGALFNGDLKNIGKIRVSRNNDSIWFKGIGATDSVERLIFNLNLEKGDSMDFSRSSQSSKTFYYVDSINYVNGLKTIFFRSDSTWKEPLKMIEGVGPNLPFVYWGFELGILSQNVVCKFDGEAKVYSTSNFEFKDCGFSITSSLEASNIEDKIKLYPNPNNAGILIVASTGIVKRVVIYNLLGYPVFGQNGNTTINIEHLSAGVYIVEVTNQNGRQTKQKLVIQ